MGTWLNNDGLYIKYGTSEGPVQKGGALVGPELQTYQFKITATELAATSGILMDTVIIPKNARIEEVEVIAETACTSGDAAALNIGLIRTDRSTAYDADGLVAALALTSLNADQEKTVLRVGSTSAGALIGTTLEYPGLFVADYDTAAYTAGVILVRVKWYRVNA